jgi:hypothetical protein
LIRIKKVPANRRFPPPWLIEDIGDILPLRHGWAARHDLIKLGYRPKWVRLHYDFQDRPTLG